MEEELSYEGSYRSPEALYDPFRRRSMMMRKKEREKEKGEKETRRGKKKEKIRYLLASLRSENVGKQRVGRKEKGCQM